VLIKRCFLFVLCAFLSSPLDTLSPIHPALARPLPCVCSRHLPLGTRICDRRTTVLNQTCLAFARPSRCLCSPCLLRPHSSRRHHLNHYCHHYHRQHLFLFTMSDQCALDESGGLKEAKDIEFFFSESETTPLASSAASLQRNPGNTGKSHTSSSL
jgi:hypothetical protein